LRLIASPYHDGVVNVDRGQGPARVLDGLRDFTSVQPIPVEMIAPVDTALPEAARVFALNRRLAERVSAALREDAFPLVLAGDCNSCLGVVAGCGSDDLGVVWFDAHADFDTPEDTASGSLDAMGLAVLTGAAWQALSATIPGFAAIDEESVLLVAVRDLEPRQRERLRQSKVRVLEGNTFSQAEFQTALGTLFVEVERIYLHIDLDALDPSEGIANQYSAGAGLSLDQLTSAVADVFSHFDVAATAITAYNPASDPDGRMAETAARVVASVASAAAATPASRRRP
jgi:arginase